MTFVNFSLLAGLFQWGENTLQHITVREGKIFSVVSLIIQEYQVAAGKIIIDIALMGNIAGL
jgi:hypothetical protein